MTIKYEKQNNIYRSVINGRVEMASIDPLSGEVTGTGGILTRLVREGKVTICDSPHGGVVFQWNALSEVEGG